MGYVAELVSVHMKPCAEVPMRKLLDVITRVLPQRWAGNRNGINTSQGALESVVPIPDTEDSFAEYSIGRMGDNGRPITAIIARESQYVIYLTDDFKACFEATAELMNKKKVEINRFDQVNSRIFTLLPSKTRPYPAKQLGYALSGSFIYDDLSGITLIENVDKLVSDKLNEIGRFWYAGSAVLSLSLIIVIGWASMELNLPKNTIAPYAIFGAIGSTVSMISKISEVETAGFYSPSYVALMAFTRILLGGAFGIISYYLISANVVFGFLANSPGGYFVAALAAGLNERFIPDTLRKIGQA